MTKARDLANIISGGFTIDDIPNIPASKITSGTFADDRLPSTALNSNVDLTNLSASNLTSGSIPTARITTLPSGVGGKVLQIVQGKLNTHPSTNAADWVASGLEAAITPSATSSKIFISITVGAVGGSGTTAFRIWKNSSHLGGASGNSGGNREAVSFRTLVDAADFNHAQGGGYNYLDSPSTTDATTYKLYWKSQINQTSTFNYASGNSDVSYTYGSLTASTITLMEIAG